VIAAAIAAGQREEIWLRMGEHVIEAAEIPSIMGASSRLRRLAIFVDS
jgi:hypothetical protein